MANAKSYRIDKKPVKRAIARLVDDVDNDYSKWSANDNQKISNMYENSAMCFSKDLSDLSGRADPLVKLINKRKLGKGNLGLKPLTAAIRGSAITLQQIVKIDDAVSNLKECLESPLTAKKYKLTKDDIEEAKRLLSINDDDEDEEGVEWTLFKMGDNSIVRSMHWANPIQLRSFRKSYGLSKRQLADIVKGDEDDTLFEHLEKGNKQNGKNKAYRITKPTAKLIYQSFQVIHNTLDIDDTVDHEKEGTEPVTIMPDYSALFDDSHIAGPGGGKKTEALSIANGNMLEQPEDIDSVMDAIKKRVEAYKEKEKNKG